MKKGKNMNIELPKFGNDVMTPLHKRWDEFRDLLTGVDGCDFKKNKKGEHAWMCKHDHSLTCRVLKKHFPKIDIEKTLAIFNRCGGHCDCEILFNVENGFASVAFNPAPEEMWFEFMTGSDSMGGLCGFCLNTGRVQGMTGQGVVVNGRFCICPNGRDMAGQERRIKYEKKKREVKS